MHSCEIMKKKLILFDIDGTLITRCISHKKSFSKGFEKAYGIKADLNDTSYRGKTDKRIIIEIMKKHGLSKKQVLFKINDAYEAMSKYVKQMIGSDNSIKPITNVRKLLVELEKNGHILGLVTGNIEKVAKMKLEKVGLLKFFDIGEFGDSSEMRSRLVKNAIKDTEEKFKIKFRKKDVFVIGDTPLDIEAGKEVDVMTIAVSTGRYSLSELEKYRPNYVFENLRNYKKIIDIIDA